MSCFAVSIADFSFEIKIIVKPVEWVVLKHQFSPSLERVFLGSPKKAMTYHPFTVPKQEDVMGVLIIIILSHYSHCPNLTPAYCILDAIEEDRKSIRQKG